MEDSPPRVKAAMRREEYRADDLGRFLVGNQAVSRQTDEFSYRLSLQFIT